jgi:hypothetical protein
MPRILLKLLFSHSITLHESKNKPILVDEPTRALWEESHANRQNNGGYHLQAPRNPKRGDTVDIRTSELNKELQKDTYQYYLVTDMDVSKRRMIPQVIDHCCRETIRPRIAGAVISD